MPKRLTKEELNLNKKNDIGHAWREVVKAHDPSTAKNLQSMETGVGRTESQYVVDRLTQVNKSDRAKFVKRHGAQPKY